MEKGNQIQKVKKEIVRIVVADRWTVQELADAKRDSKAP
jgi:hypothetical protein